jgi:hypothetical protein
LAVLFNPAVLFQFVYRRSVSSDAHELAPPSVGIKTLGSTMKVTAAVDYMATDAIKPANGLPLPQQGDVITNDEDLEIEVGEANQQQQNPGHLAKIVTLTNGNGGIYREDKPGKAAVNGTSKCMKTEPLPSDLIVANGDSQQSTPRNLQDMTDFTASRELRYFQFSPTRTVNIRAR